MAVPAPANSAYYVARKYYEKRFLFRDNLFSGKLRVSENLFQKNLLAHYGCVNAIEFSNEGELLVSGGDDRRVLLWSVPHIINDNGSPIEMKKQHDSNIFCLGFDSVNSKIFSAGNDDQVIVHDLKTRNSVQSFLHEKPVYGLSVSPADDNVFTSAGDDGRILLYDVREPSSTEPLCIAKYKTAFHAVMFNPIESCLLATANSKEGIALWDTRKPRTPAIQYGDKPYHQSGMSVRWNSNGTRLLALRRRLPPVLYAIHKSEHVCQFYHPKYYNSCTMKSCCFAGNYDEYVMSGSDNFTLFMWKIDESALDNKHWESNAHMLLCGHRSIVNQVRYNPQHCIIASSGVEKMVKMWSPVYTNGWEATEEVENPRAVFTHEQYISLIQDSGQVMSHDYSHQSTQEDSRMIAFFDSLVQREIEGWQPDQNGSDSESVTSPRRSESDSDTASSSALSPDSDTTTEYLADNEITSSYALRNRIDQLIAEKQPELFKLAKRPSLRPRHESHTKRPKLKSIIKTVRKDHRTACSTTLSNSRSNYRTRLSRRQANLTQSSRSAPESRKRSYDSFRRRKYTLCNSGSTSDQAGSLDTPSTSTGITASSSGSSVYRVVEQDSDDEQLTQNGNADDECNANSTVESPPERQFINILPTPLNGTHDMYINILHVPVRNGQSVITISDENEFEAPTSTSNNSGEEDALSQDSDSSSVDYLNENVTPITPVNGKRRRISDESTPDSGIAMGACSSAGSAYGSRSDPRNGCPPGNGSRLRSNEDWVLMEGLISRFKKDERNIMNYFGNDSDSN